MPLEVREIGIRFSVEDASNGPGSGAAESGEPTAALLAQERSLLVEECVRAVLRELERSRER